MSDFYITLADICRTFAVATERGERNLNLSQDIPPTPLFHLIYSHPIIMTIRTENPCDYRKVEELTREAFWNVYRPGCTEHFVLHTYRPRPEFIPELSLVLEDAGRLVGHVMFSKAELHDDAGGVHPAWTFGPISILPELQRRRYGLTLLREALLRARKMGVGMVCMEGNINFYRHAGFQLACRMGIHYHSEPRGSVVPYFLAQELIPGFLAGMEATYAPPAGYFAADDHPEAFKAYDATFPPKEKRFLPGQLPQFCKSCGKPLSGIGDCGREADGSVCFDLCSGCHKAL